MQWLMTRHRVRKNEKNGNWWKLNTHAQSLAKPASTSCCASSTSAPPVAICEPATAEIERPRLTQSRWEWGPRESSDQPGNLRQLKAISLHTVIRIHSMSGIYIAICWSDSIFMQALKSKKQLTFIDFLPCSGLWQALRAQTLLSAWQAMQKTRQEHNCSNVLKQNCMGFASVNIIQHAFWACQFYPIWAEEHLPSYLASAGLCLRNLDTVIQCKISKNAHTISY